MDTREGIRPVAHLSRAGLLLSRLGAWGSVAMHLSAHGGTRPKRPLNVARLALPVARSIAADSIDAQTRLAFGTIGASALRGGARLSELFFGITRPRGAAEKTARAIGVQCARRGTLRTRSIADPREARWIR